MWTSPTVSCAVSHFLDVLVVLISFSFQILAVSPDAHCYTGNGTISTDFPCKLSNDVSFCCGVGWSCLSNGLCQYRASTSFAEGTCTDKSFPANSCLGLCLASGNSEKTLIHDCGGAGNGDTNSWCCAGVQGVTGQGEDCCSSNATTTLDSFPYSTVTVITAISTSSGTASSTSASSKSSSSLSSSVSAPKATSTTTSSATPSIPVSAVATPTSSTTGSVKSTTSHAAAIGAGIGVPVGIALLAALLYLLHRERKTKRQISDLQAHMQGPEGKPSDQDVPLAGTEWTSQTPARANFELDTGIDCGELPASDGRHEMAGRHTWEMS